MKTIEELKAEIKETLIQNGLNYTNDGSVFARVNESIQWAWENWEEDIIKEFYEGEKPEDYTEEFMTLWIDNEDLFDELEDN